MTNHLRPHQSLSVLKVLLKKSVRRAKKKPVQRAKKSHVLNLNLNLKLKLIVEQMKKLHYLTKSRKNALSS